MKPWLLILIGAVIIVLLDFLWLGVVMKSFYDRIPGKGDIRIVAAIAVWLLISAGIVLFALPLATNWQTSVLWGAVFGFILYAVYDLTNYAVLARWPLSIVAVDIAWGTVLCAVTSATLYLLR